MILSLLLTLLCIRGLVALTRDLRCLIRWFEATSARAWQAYVAARRARAGARERIRREKRERLGLVQAASVRELAGAMADLVTQLNEARSEIATLRASQEQKALTFPGKRAEELDKVC